MDISLTPDHEAVRNATRDFCCHEILPHLRDWERAEQIPADIVPKLAAQGLLGLCIPRRYGGLGLDYLSLGIVCEELERADTAFRVLIAVHLPSTRWPCCSGEAKNRNNGISSRRPVARSWRRLR